MSEHPAVTKFREYLRIKTVQPKPDNEAAKEFLKLEAEALGLPFKTTQVKTDTGIENEVYTMTWEGTDPSLPSLLLNSHTDVVPVYPEHWKYDPFSAHKDENGDIYARGSQDMKNVGIQYLEAVKRLKESGQRFPRTIHLTFVPDEEIGGHGMKPLVLMEEFKNLNIGFVLDEGLANPTDSFTVFYGERSIWWVRVSCPGKPGHGSRFIPDSAAEKLRKVINNFLEFRDKEEKRLKTNPILKLGDVTTVNMTMIEGGIQYNVVPTEFHVGFDIRITPTVDLVEFEKMIEGWCKEAGSDVSYEFIQKFTGNTMTPIDDRHSWWNAFKSATDEMGLELELEIFPAATDSRFLREAGYQAIGFSPMNNTPILLHDHNEFINEKIFLKGIDIYEKIIPKLASVPPL